jgi:serine/threonine protein kinase
MTTVKLKSLDGTEVVFEKRDPMYGGLKDVYFTSDRRNVVAFYRKPLDIISLERLEKLVGTYRDGIFNREGGDYWRELFRWPQRLVKDGDLVGLVAPAYQECFFFGSDTNLSGVEKDGKWFTSAKNFNRFLPAGDKGNLLSYLRICFKLSQAVRRLHAAGLAHSDLSYKNCLADPASGSACIIDIDGLVVPGLFPPDVVGTTDFIAPEVVMTMGLDRHDPNRKLPCRETDQHALSVLIYLYLFRRHPLRGSRVLSLDSIVQEVLEMGKMALFIEDPNDSSNRYKVKEDDEQCLPWVDTEKLPYTIMGPHLVELFNRAFIDGLHHPSDRPSADDWEVALVKTMDLLQPCLNPQCVMGWYVFANTRKPVCPYCGTPFKGKLPMLDFYSTRDGGSYLRDNHRLMVYKDQYIYPWHVEKGIFPNEKLLDKDKKPVGYFSVKRGEWLFVNQTLDDMLDVDNQLPIPRGKYVKLKNGQNILLKKGPAGRLARVTLEIV